MTGVAAQVAPDRSTEGHRDILVIIGLPPNLLTVDAPVKFTFGFCHPLQRLLALAMWTRCPGLVGHRFFQILNNGPLFSQIIARTQKAFQMKKAVGEGMHRILVE